MPAYNAEKFIVEAIDSILAQTYADFELIILDDGSKDNTAAIVQSYGDARVKIVRKNNEGVATTLNRGIELAKGEYIWRHDADDTSSPERLEKQIRFLKEHPDVLLCSTQIAFMTERGHIAENKKQPKDSWFAGNSWKQVDYDDFNPFSPVTHATILVRTSIIRKLQGYRVQFKTAEDIDLWLRMMEIGQLAVLNECLYNVRLSKSSATAVHGWKNNFYRELAKSFYLQRQSGRPDDLEVHGVITEPAPPSREPDIDQRTGLRYRHDLLDFQLAVNIDARDWKECTRIIWLAFRDGWRLSRVYKRVFILMAPNWLTRLAVHVKSRIS